MENGDDSLHAACNSCYYSVGRHGLSGSCCPLVACTNPDCRFKIHSCKLADHLEGVCQFQRVACVNKCNGCPFEVERGRMHLHLSRCPASVVRCSAEWNRWPIEKPNRKKSFVTDQVGIGQWGGDTSSLDLAFAKRDQRLFYESLKIPLKLKSVLKNSVNKKFPAVPVEVPLLWLGYEETNSTRSTSSTTVSSDDDPTTPWNRSKSPPGLVSSITSSKLFHPPPIFDIEGPVSSGDLLSLRGLLYYLRQVSRCVGEDRDLAINVENVEEILSQVEKNAAAVKAVADAVLVDLVVYPKKIAEQLRHVASDLEDWIADFLEIVENLSLIFRRIPVPEICRLDSETQTDSVFNAVLLRKAHLGILRQIEEALSITTSMAIELDNALAITEDTKPNEISRSLLAFVVQPLKIATSLNQSTMESVGSKDNHPVPFYCNVDETETVSPPKPFSLKVPPFGRNFGLAGLKQLADTYKPLENLKTDVNVNAQVEIFKIKPSTPSSSVSSNEDLSLRLEKEMMSRFQSKPKTMYTFLCARDFRRDEIAMHVRSCHDVIEPGLGGWVEKRCPLARLGCPYVCYPVGPSSGRVVFDTHLQSFAIRVDSSVSEDSSSLERCPVEILQSIFVHLDGASMNNLALTSTKMRDVCYSLLELKGLVVPVWKRIARRSEEISSAWRVSHYRWKFSSNVNIPSWRLTEDAWKMTDHLSKCPFNIVDAKTEKTLVVFQKPWETHKSKSRNKKKSF